MFYEESSRPAYSDLDRDGLMTHQALLSVFEKAAGHHSELAADDMMTGREKGVSWILAEWRVAVSRRPGGQDVLNVRTWTRGRGNTAVVYRDLVMTDAAGEELARAEAKFVLMDITTGRLTRVSDELIAAYGPEQELVFDSDAPRLRPLEHYSSEKPFALRRSDIDINGHVHNTKYMDLMIEALPEYPRLGGVKAFRFCCLKSVKEGDAVVLCCEETPGAYYTAVMTEAGCCAAAELERGC